MKSGEAIANVRRRILWVLLADSCCAWLGFWLFAVGGGVFGLRHQDGLDWKPVVAAFAMVSALLLTLCWQRARQRLPGTVQLAALLDASCRAGGLLMLESAGGGNAWAAGAPLPCPGQLPGVRWQRGRLWLPVLGLCFVALAAVVPLRPELAWNRRLPLERQAGALAKDIAALEKLEVITKEQAEAWREAVARIVENSRAEDPLLAWEALDELRRNLQQRAEVSAAELAEQNASSQEWAAAAEALNELLRNNPELAGAEAARLAAKEIAETLEKLAASNQEVARMLNEMRQGQAAAGTGQNQDLQKLLESAAPGAPDVVARIQELLRAGMSPDELAKALESGCNQAALGKPLPPEIAKALEDLEKRLRADPELAKAMAELARVMRLAMQAAAENAGSCSGQSGGGKPRQAEALTQEQIEQLCAGIKNMNAAQIRRLAELMELGQITLKPLGRDENAENALLAFLGANPQCAGLAACLGGSLPGSGGISRGPGAAPLNLTGATDENGATFKERELPRPDLASLQKSQLTKVTLSTPDSAETPELSTGGALDTAMPGRSSAADATLLPRHRGAVETFFRRQE